MVFVVDTALEFGTEKYDPVRKKVIKDRKKVAYLHLKSQFILDTLGLLPLASIFEK